jgi:molybdopterin converting factor small subunit
MKIHLRLFGELKRYTPEGERRGRAAVIDVPDGTTALQLILRLGIPYGGDEGQMVVAINDVESPHETPLRDGDTLSLFEPLAGG